MKWLVVALLWAVALLNYLDRQIVFSLFPVLEHDLHASPVQLGLIGTVFLWTYGLLSPFAGAAGDRFGRVRIIIASLVVWSVATLLTAHVAGLTGMLFTRGLMGASEAFYLPAALALIAETHSDATRSLATGIHQSGLYTGLVLGGAWGGWMGDHVGWRPAFQILGFIGAVYAVILALVLSRTQHSGSVRAVNLRSPWRALASNRLFAVLTAGFTVMAIVNWVVYTWLPLFLYERFHLSMAGAGFSATFYIQAASYAGAIVGGILTDRWTACNKRAPVYMQALGLAIAAPFLFLLAFANTSPLLVIALVTFGVGRGFFDCSAMPALLTAVPSQLSGAGYGIFNSAGCLVGGVAAVVAGYLKAHFGLGVAFEGAALILMGGSAVLSCYARFFRHGEA
jgi:MFS family permease